jgi:hypothetical protein
VNKRLEEYGDVMTRDDVREWAHIGSVRALYSRIEAQQFPPADLTRPMRWFRQSLMRWRDEGARPNRRTLRKVVG